MMKANVHLNLPAIVDLMSASLPAAAPVTKLLALSVSATCCLARRPCELVMETGDGGVEHQWHQETERCGTEINIRDESNDRRVPRIELIINLATYKLQSFTYPSIFVRNEIYSLR